MAKIYLVRHAESIANAAGIYQGQTYDTGLSFLGEKQAEFLAKRLAGLEITKIISSPLKRARQTAQKISERSKKEIFIQRAIIETNHGEWEGKTKKWIEENYDGLYTGWLKNPSETVFPGGEKFSDTIKRTRDFIKYTNQFENSVIVTHDNIIRIVICLIREISIDKIWTISLDAAGITTIDLGKNGFKIVELNMVDHLSSIRSDLSSHAL